MLLDIVLNKFWKYRKAFGLSFFFFGAPIVYFLRDGIGLAPGSMAFTAALTLGSLIFVIPKNLFKTVYMPNVLAYWLSCIFLLLAWFYLIFYCPNAGWFTNQYASSGYILIILGMYLLLATVSINELKDTFVPITFFISLLGCLLVTYYVARNPLFTVGMKFGITLGSGDESITNSHIFGKGGFATAFSGIILLRSVKRPLLRLAVIGGIALGLVVLLLAQSMSSVLAFGLAITIYFFYNVSFSKVILKSYNMLWNWRFLLVLFGFLYFITSFWYKYENTVANVYSNVGGRLERIINTVFLGETKDWRTSDLSAKDRLGSIQSVFADLQENYDKGNVFPLLLGNGYEKKYVDSPVIQSFNDFGLLGFVLYVSMLLVFLKSMLTVMRDRQNDFTSLICYIFCLVFVQNFTAGMVIDYPKWCYFALIARFAIPHIIYAKPKATIQSA